jgi:hypothetical protein
LLGGPDLPFTIFPMLMYHASQLIIDTVVASRMKASDTIPVAVAEGSTSAS